MYTQTPKHANASRSELQIIMVIGLPSALCNADLLRADEWFGQFGDILTICIRQPQYGSSIAYLQYSHVLGAAKAIQKMHLYRIPHTNDVIRVRYNVNDLCTSFMNESESVQTTLDLDQDFALTMDNAIYDAHDRSKDIKSHEDELKELQKENDRIRTKHCALIRDFNILEQKYSAMRDAEWECAELRKQLSNATISYKSLQKHLILTQDQLHVTVQSNLELQQCVFQDCALPASHQEHVSHEEEGVLKYDSDCSFIPIH
eukprot:467508_1